MTKKPNKPKDEKDLKVKPLNEEEKKEADKIAETLTDNLNKQSSK